MVCIPELPIVMKFNNINDGIRLTKAGHEDMSNAHIKKSIFPRALKT